MNRRVVITGMGMVSSLGQDTESTWQAVLAGCSGLGPITLFDTSEYAVKLAGEVKNWAPERLMNNPREARRCDRYEQLALVAAAEAVRQSGLEITDTNRQRVSVIVGSATGGYRSYDENKEILRTQGQRRVSPFSIMMLIVNGAAAMISINYGVQGPSMAVVTSCATGADNIGQALRMIRDGTIDAAIAGGAECPITEVGAVCLDRLNVMSHHIAPPELACAPFDLNRNGLVMGEGAGIVVVEALEHAQARGATILAELIGYGASADAYHLTSPDEDGAGEALAMQRAMTDAHIGPSDIDYINAHGTATKMNDLVETRAVKRAFGEHAYRIPMSSTKGQIGHAMGATSAMEGIFCIKAIHQGVIPPTINLNTPDPDCDLDYVPLVARRVPVQTTMSNALGLGGHNASLIFRAFVQ